MISELKLRIAPPSIYASAMQIYLTGNTIYSQNGVILENINILDLPQVDYYR